MKKLITLLCLVFCAALVKAQALFIDSNYNGKYNLYAYNGDAYLSITDTAQNFNDFPAKVDGTTGAITILNNDVSASSYLGAGNYIYFVGVDANNDSELWRTDGTPQGTFRLKDIDVNGSGVPHPLLAAPGRSGLVFQAYDGDSYGLWETDGTTAGTTQIVDFAQYPPLTQVDFITNVNGKVFLLAYTASGTYAYGLDNTFSLLNPAPVSAGGLSYYKPARIGNSQYYMNSNLTFTDIIKTNGTTAELAYTFPFFMTSISSIGNNLLIGVSDQATGGLYKCDTLFTSLNLVKDVEPNPLFSNSEVGEMEKLQDTVFFIGQDNAHGTELWRTDGTTAGTNFVRDISPGPASSLLQYVYGNNVWLNGNLRASCDKVFFQANDGSPRPEMWASDGTALGTMPAYTLLDSLTQPGYMYIDQVSIADEKLFLSAYSYNGQSHQYMWRVNTCDSFPQIPLPPPTTITSVNHNQVVQLYPNPAESELHISGMEVIQATVSNAIGQKQELAIVGNKINISQFIAGVYYLTLSNGIGDRRTVSFIKR